MLFIYILYTTSINIIRLAKSKKKKNENRKEKITRKKSYLFIDVPRMCYTVHGGDGI